MEMSFAIDRNLCKVVFYNWCSSSHQWDEMICKMFFLVSKSSCRFVPGLHWRGKAIKGPFQIVIGLGLFLDPFDGHRPDCASSHPWSQSLSLSAGLRKSSVGKGVIGYREDAEDLRKKPRNRIMAGKLSNVASRIMGGNGVVGRSVASSLRLRSGMGLPVGKHIVPEKPVSIYIHLFINPPCVCFFFFFCFPFAKILKASK